MRRLFVAAICCIVLTANVDAEWYLRCYGKTCLTINYDPNPVQIALSNVDSECIHCNAPWLLAIPDAAVQNSLEQFVTDWKAVMYYYYSSFNTPNDIWLKATKYTITSWTWVNGQIYDGEMMDQAGQVSFDNAYAYLGNGTRDPNKSQLYGAHASNPRSHWSSYICEIYDATVGTCLSQFNGSLLNGRCFITGELSTAGTWFDARNMCLSQGDLASFDHIDLSSLRNISWLNSTQTYWIGLSRNKWTLGGINDTEVKYTHWSSGYPININYGCICVNFTDWTWKDCDCVGVHGVVCSNNAAVLSTVAPSTSAITATTQLQLGQTSTTSPPSPNIIPTNAGSDRFAEGIGIGIAIGFGLCMVVMMVVVVYLCRKISKLSRTANQENTKNDSDHMYESQLSAHIYDGVKNEPQYEHIDDRK